MIKNSKCPQCHKALDVSEEVNFVTSLARCNDCNIVIDLGQNKKSSYLSEKLSFVDPSQFESKRVASGTQISFKWKKNWFLVLFSVFWNVITFVVLESYTSSDELDFLMIPAIVLGISHPTVGLITAYSALLSFINKTVILVNYNEVKVTSSPLPVPFQNKTIRRQDIVQLYVMIYVPYTVNGIPMVRHKVVAQTHRSTVDLIKGIGDYSRAISLELEIEKALAITDEIMPDEHIN